MNYMPYRVITSLATIVMHTGCQRLDMADGAYGQQVGSPGSKCKTIG